VTERFGQQMSTLPQHSRPSPPAEAGEDPLKVRQILDGAREVFLNLGFDGASMGDIARAAGVSKGTLYVYFENKAELFSALIADERKHAKREFQLDPQSPDVSADLRRYGRSLLAYIGRPRNIQSVRTVIAIAEKFPKVGQEFYRDGPQRGLEYLRSYLEAQVAAGRLRIDDCAMAARQLQVLFHTGVINELLYGVRSTPDESEVGRVADEAVATFMARYAAGVRAT
jgi:AcrR family transcriptional regulator